MESIKRRVFLSKSSKTALGVSAAVMAGKRTVIGANDQIVMGVVGLGGRGQMVTRTFARDPRVTIKTMCDPDSQKGNQLVSMLKDQHNAGLQRLVDFREMLDDKDIDAVIIATPDHWHALATIWACQAGKDVYVEKPASHTLWEGRKMVEAARKYNCIVQVGTQSRSGPYMAKAIEYVRSGNLGPIHLCKVYNVKSGEPYYEEKAPQNTEGVDLDLWAGPAPMDNARFGRSHAWLYYWDFANSDMMSDGIHQVDLARWLIDKDFPKSVHSIGGNFAFDDDRQVPDTQIASFEYDDMVMSIEMTQYTKYMTKTSMEVRESDLFPHWPTNSTRIELYGHDGLMIVGRHGGGWQVFTTDGKVVAQEYGRFPDVAHKDNFIECVQSRKLPNADIEEGHRSCALVHLACVAYRLGGKRLLFDKQTETTDDSDANRLLRRVDREPYVVPEQV